MRNLRLREVCEGLGVSRRAVQGYEKAGLVRASGKTDRGYLLYDEEARERILELKMYQDFGFTVMEIKSFLESEPDKRREELLRKELSLKAKRLISLTNLLLCLRCLRHVRK